jgi:transcriptional regulator with XRE-family HTH domain
MADSIPPGTKPPRHPPLIQLEGWCEYREMTYSDLADCVGVDKGVISRIVNGHREIKTGLLVKMAKCLDCEVYQLFTTDPRKDPPIEDLIQQVPEGERERLRRIIETFTVPAKSRTRKPTK